ncbi:MAG: HEAT repeat domain-containing protein [Acidobacteria bacterium]|nr:HEAT repeat domain-containing protein [Acidobacteriota bacterium]
MPVLAQTPPRDRPAPPPGREDAARLGQGWAALAAGRAQEAVAAADDVLRVAPGNHHAVGLKVEALAATDIGGALNAYETWLLRRHEDAYLLAPVAKATVRQIAESGDLDLRIRALEILARAGDPDAPDALQGLRVSGQGAIATAAALARLGSIAATGELISMAAMDTAADRSAVAAALATAGPAAVPALTSMLSSPRAPERAAAVKALGTAAAANAVEQIRPLMRDSDPFVRSTTAVTLARLGDAEGEAVTLRMLDIDVPEIQLMAAEAWSGQPGAWMSVVAPLLDNMDGTIRLQAARLMAPVDPAAAGRALAAAASDENPGIRAEALRTAHDVATSEAGLLETSQLRRLLRDPDPAVRLHAAGLLVQRAQ